MDSGAPHEARFLSADRTEEATGAVVVVDVLRAFTTAAYALASGATRIVLVDSVAAALAFKAAHPGAVAMGEDHGLRPDGFDFANSPAQLARADLSGLEVVQRTSAGTRGVVAARGATRLWCASLVCASATAAAVNAAGSGAPDYVITGRHDELAGEDDLLTAEFIERVRTGRPADAARTARAVADSREAAITLALGAGHVDPADIELATRVDAFDFAMEATREAQDSWAIWSQPSTSDGLRGSGPT